MQLIQQKLLKNFITPFSLTLFLTLGILWLTKFISLIELVSMKGLVSYKLFSLAFLVIPDLIFYMLPFALIVAFNLFFQNIFISREIYIFRNLPIQPKKLLLPIKKLIIFLIFFQILNAFIFAPIASKKFQQIKFDIKHNLISMILSEGKIEIIRKDLVSYYDHKDEFGIMDNIFIYNYDESEKFIFAEKADIINDENNLALKLFKGKIVTVNNDNQVRLMNFDEFDDDIIVSNSQKLKQKNYKNFTILDILNNLNKKEEFHPDIQAGLLFKLIWALLPIIIFLAARELYFFGEFRRSGLGKKHLLFSFLSIFFIVTCFFLKSFLKENFFIGILIITLVFFIIFIFTLFNFSNKL